ncbi:MAG TPA: V-type ATP synthase subunit D [Gemmatimonadales bacterium]|nr:V-type ATP synthase subunit D [Gemmatimonadales bacterium]
MNLLRAARRLERVTKGTALLRRKREALVRELFRLARPARDARERISVRVARAYPALLRALALHGLPGLRALGWPTRDLLVELRAGSVWGIAVASIEARPPVIHGLGARGTAPGATGPAAVEAAREFEELTELLLDAAPREMLIRRLGAALAQTSRQVNTLERRLAPDLRRELVRVRQALDEREREERIRLKHLLTRSSRTLHPEEGILGSATPGGGGG